MTLEAAFRALSGEWQQLHDQLNQDLLWAITETRPAGGHTLANRYEDAVTDLLDKVQAAITASQSLAEGKPTLAQASQALTICQESFQHIGSRFSADLLSYRAIGELLQFGRERGTAWRDWAEHVQTALERCRAPLDQLNQALLQCWQEISDRVGMTSVSVQATNIGQQITTVAENRSAGQEAIT